MNKLLFALLILLIAIIAYLFFQARASARRPSPQLIGGLIPDCPDKPNCVSSAAATTDAHYIEPLVISDMTMAELQRMVESDGGTVIQVTDQLLVATYKSALFGFIDDLLLLRNEGSIEVRSSSRVGYSDFDANRKRVERLRASGN